MTKSLFFAILITVNFQLSAQWGHDVDNKWSTSQASGIIFNSNNPDAYGHINFEHNEDLKWLVDFGTADTYNLRYSKYFEGVRTDIMQFDYLNNEIEILNSNVGIGTVAPESLLHIKKNTDAKIRIESTINSGQKWDLISSGGEIIRSGSFGILDVKNNLTRFVILNNGNIGIGTTIPKNKLSVNGTVCAKEVKVSLTDAADWVFEDDYKLRSLEEVERFINTNKHLPDMPSADDFRKNDLNVAEMDNRLLQKVEELTLYMIQLNKELGEVKKKNQLLEKEVVILKNK